MTYYDTDVVEAPPMYPRLTDINNKKNNNLSREEKVMIISSLMSGLGNTAIFEEDALKERIKTCLKIAGECL